jgi:carboxyl-terminal processing protease
VAVRQRWLLLLVSCAVIGGVVALASGAAGGAARGVYRLVSLFGRAVSLVRSSYVEEVPLEKLEFGAMGGLVEAVDPGGQWIPEEMVAEYAKVRSRPLPPFGMALGRRSSYPFVLQVLPDSPAAKAGIVPGELIERVGTEPVRARPLWRALVLLDAAERGGAGVTLDVIDRQLMGKRAVVLNAGAAAAPSSTVELKEGVAVVRVASVDATGASAIGSLLPAGAQVSAVVVDLRGLAIGTPEGAVQVACQLVGGDAELKMEMTGGKSATLKEAGPSRTWKVVVCLDATTAGPGELLATLLKARGATLVGGDSYGDTGLRRPLKSAGGEVWLAAEWGLGPDGKAILGTGLKPDERVRPRKDADAVLERAMELAGGRAAVKQAA